jgi:hypothetical protein
MKSLSLIFIVRLADALKSRGTAWQENEARQAPWRKFLIVARQLFEPPLYLEREETIICNG